VTNDSPVDARPLVRHFVGIRAVLEAASNRLRASAAAQRATREAADVDLPHLLDAIETVSSKIAQLRDEATATAVRAGITNSEGRALTLLQQELAHLHPPPPQDVAGAASAITCGEQGLRLQSG
jgi:hypothetical protein